MFTTEENMITIKNGANSSNNAYKELRQQARKERVTFLLSNLLQMQTNANVETTYAASSPVNLYGLLNHCMYVYDNSYTMKNRELKAKLDIDFVDFYETKIRPQFIELDSKSWVRNITQDNLEQLTVLLVESDLPLRQLNWQELCHNKEPWTEEKAIESIQLREAECISESTSMLRI